MAGIKLTYLAALAVTVIFSSASSLTRYGCQLCKEQMGRDVCAEYGPDKFELKNFTCAYKGITEFDGKLVDVQEGDIKLPSHTNATNMEEYVAELNNHTTDAQGPACTDSRCAHGVPIVPGGSDLTWKGGEVPYTFHHSFSQHSRRIVLGAIKDMEEKTCVRWVPRYDEQSYVEFYSDGQGCSSFVGFQRQQPFISQQISLSPNCISHGVALHEMMHALGFFHEQSRPDRDKFVKIEWNLIEADRRANFKKYELKGRKGFIDMGYDYGSIMHYPASAFPKPARPHEMTIIPYDHKTGRLRPDIFIGQRERMSQKDVDEINVLYHCSEHMRKQTTPDTTLPPTTTTVRIGSRRPTTTKRNMQTRNPFRQQVTPQTISVERRRQRCADRNKACPGLITRGLCEKFRIMATSVCPKTCGDLLGAPCGKKTTQQPLWDAVVDYQDQRTEQE